MQLSKTLAPSVLLCALAAALAPLPAAATIRDYKAFTSTECQPYGPGTTAAELTYNQLGITNPGATNETVICSTTSDSESVYADTAQLFFWFRAGAIPGKVACTAFISSATMGTGTINTVSANPANVAASNRSVGTLTLNDTSAYWSIGAPVTVVCTITPKAILGGFTFREDALTNVNTP
jgi:hypothetical protein